MHIQHARPPLCHLGALSIPRRPRARFRRPRRQPPLLVTREACLHPGDHQSSPDARRGHLHRRLEPRWQMGRQRRGGRRRQSLCPMTMAEVLYTPICVSTFKPHPSYPFFSSLSYTEISNRLYLERVEYSYARHPHALFFTCTLMPSYTKVACMHYGEANPRIVFSSHVFSEPDGLVGVAWGMGCMVDGDFVHERQEMEMVLLSIRSCTVISR